MISNYLIQKSKGMLQETVLSLNNPQSQNTDFKIIFFDNEQYFANHQRLNYYSVILVLNGEGKVRTDFSSCSFERNSMMFFSPYQPFIIKNTNSELNGVVLNFHPDFLCVYKHHKEIACNGLLFDSIYDSPVLTITTEQTENLLELIEKMRIELTKPCLAQYELVISYLKIFLITATRIKLAQLPELGKKLIGKNQPVIMQKLKDAIEMNYKTKHAASDYAALLNTSAKSLAKITKDHLNKTLSDLISERVVLEAKRELYLTSKTIKEIAYGLGYVDEYYFSRFFKTNTGVSPQFYRQRVGFAKAEL